MGKTFGKGMDSIRRIMLDSLMGGQIHCNLIMRHQKYERKLPNGTWGRAIYLGLVPSLCPSFLVPTEHLNGSCRPCSLSRGSPCAAVQIEEKGDMTKFLHCFFCHFKQNQESLTGCKWQSWVGNFGLSFIFCSMGKLPPIDFQSLLFLCFGKRVLNCNFHQN